MSRKRYKLALAGLLHDIGKFAQHAGVELPKVWDDQAKKNYDYKHAFLTHNFVSTYSPNDVAEWASKHHIPTKPEERLIRLADQLSSGEYSSTASSQKENNRETHPKQLRSIYDSLTIQDEITPEIALYPLKKLRLKDEVVFPMPEEEKADQVRKAYQQLWRGFTTDVEKLETNQDTPTYIENMLELMKQYTWSVPVARGDTVPDISLYDHNRMTAALAVCLDDLPSGKVKAIQTARDTGYLNPKELSSQQEKLLQEEPVALLVGGDISGVQDFIYSITSKRAAKTLRGRSFYLQLLTEAILRYTLAELDLPYTNVIYAGGGHFFLLAPPSAADQLLALKRSITEKMLHYHGTRLYFALGATQVPADGFNKGEFPTYWAQMHSDIAKAKRQRYTELGDDLYTEIFTPPQHGGNEENTCAVCGEERKGTKEIDEVKVCPMCDSFAEEIGKNLPYSDFVILGLGDPDELLNAQDDADGNALSVLRSFGVEVGWSKSFGKPETESPIQSDHVNCAIIWALDDVEKFPNLPSHLPTVKKTHYTVNLVPKNKYDYIMPFDDIIKEKSKGLPRLGVLRMDVDNLGNIFKFGFRGKNKHHGHKKEQNIATLTRLSALSFQTSLFFEGWIKEICHRVDENSIYAVYAGGDDIFLIGPWYQMPRLAHTITTELYRYTNHHPGIHLSGGMTFIHGKYPVYQAADNAGDAESIAKAVDGKNAFHFLGEICLWDDFVSLEQKYKDILKLAGPKDKTLNLEEEIGKEPLAGPNAIIQILRDLYAEKLEKQRKNDAVFWGSWMWHGDYRLHRLADRQRKDGHPTYAKGIDAIRNDLDDSFYESLEQWALTARWAELRMRKGK